MTSRTGTNDVSDWIDQLITQGFLVRDGEYQKLSFTLEGRLLMRGEGLVRLNLPRKEVSKMSGKKAVAASLLDDDDKRVFEVLRVWRKDVADERGVPPFVIFSDATLRELAIARPIDPSALLAVKGIGTSKLEAFGDALLRLLAERGDAP